MEINQQLQAAARNQFFSKQKDTAVAGLIIALAEKSSFDGMTLTSAKILLKSPKSGYGIHRHEYYGLSATARAEAAGYITIEKSGAGERLTLTQAGQEYYKTSYSHHLQLLKYLIRLKILVKAMLSIMVFWMLLKEMMLKKLCP